MMAKELSADDVETMVAAGAAWGYPCYTAESCDAPLRRLAADWERLRTAFTVADARADALVELVNGLEAERDQQAARIAALQQQVLDLTDAAQVLEHDYEHAKARIVALEAALRELEDASTAYLLASLPVLSETARSIRKRLGNARTVARQALAGGDG